MVINIIIKVLDNVSEEAELSPVPLMYSDEASSAIKGKTQASPESSAFGGIILRKEKECGVRLLPTCVPGLNAKSKAVGLFYDFE